MKKALTAIAAAGVLAAALAAPTSAEAGRRWWGPAVGGYAAGAVVAGAWARPYSSPCCAAAPIYVPAPVYAPAPVYYYAPGPIQYEYYVDPYRAYAPCCGR